MKAYLRLLLPILLMAALHAQDKAEPNALNAAPDGLNAELSKVLQQVVDPLQDSSAELKRLRAELEKASTDDERKEIQAKLQEEEQRHNELLQNFTQFVGGAEAAEYVGATDADLTLEHLMVDLLKPLSRWIREASTTPRELDVLREQLMLWEERQRKSEIVLDRIEVMEETLRGQQLKAELDTIRRIWQGREAKCSSQIGLIKSQIENREKQQRPMLETLSESLSSFFRSRGLNLLLGLLSGVLVFVLLRKLYEGIRRVSPVHRNKASLASRIIDIISMLLTVFIALWAVMLVFYVRGDWVLLTLAVLFLIGVVWAGKNSIPPYVEQVRTLLNLGSIREGERVIYEGLPWRVKSLGFLTTLDNPLLNGGEYRIPVRHVMNMISRMPEDKEPWFPTKVDDWVILSDETYGKVVTQTPEQVVVLRLGGSRKTYKSEDFLGSQPENLSYGYRISCSFGIDYMHQAVSTTEVPEIMEQALTEVLMEKYDREDVRSIKVEFLSAGASSLDYQILVDVSGNLASRYQAMQRLIQKICVDACNANGWVIPFTQITLHQAADGSSVDSQES